MKEYQSLEELQNDEELQNMGRYCWEKVKLNNEEVFACSTNQQYEDITWGHGFNMISEMCKHFNLNREEVSPDDLASEIRDFVLERLEEL